MKRICVLTTICLALTATAWAHPVRAMRAYVIVQTNGGGVIEQLVAGPSGMLVPLHFRGDVGSLASWTLAPGRSVRTLSAPGTILATPNGKFLYVAGCSPRERSEEIAAYRIDGGNGLARPLGAPIRLETCLTGNDAPYQTMVMDRSGHSLFALGGTTSDAASVRSIVHVHSFSIAADGRLVPTGSVQIPHYEAASYLTLDSSGTGLFFAGLPTYGTGSIRLQALQVSADGTLTPGTSIAFSHTSAISITGLIANPVSPMLYAAKYSLSAADLGTTHIIQIAIGADGSLLATPSAPIHGALSATSGSVSSESLAIAPSGRALYIMGSKIGFIPLRPDGTPAAPARATSAKLYQPQMLAFAPSGRFLYDMDGSGGFMGAPAIFVFRVAPNGNVSIDKACIGGGPNQVQFCGRIPVSTGAVVFVP